MNQENPLVSIIVITYNSAKYVVETLESTKAQTYQNIELIVSDDCSTDETVESCRNWLNLNKGRFVRTKLITSDRNTGIPANCNRGLFEATGEWLKFIAGDDILYSSGIMQAIKFIQTNPAIVIFDSIVDIYNDDLSILYERKTGNTQFYTKSKTAQEQLVLFSNNLNKPRIISTVGIFVKNVLFRELGGYNLTFPLLEDAPMWFKVLKSGHKIHYLPSPTVKYRKHQDGVSYMKSSQILINQFQLTVNKFMWNYLYKECTLINKLEIIWNNIFSKLIILLGNKGIIPGIILRFRNKFSPSAIFNKLSYITK
ncbi:glycosyltransferase family 2 protein [Microbacter margulisiae]|uniref:Alpha-1,3-rhamnosyltransferase n=1 Tax=Microbacter margulisiae TaxID=1350067 RepID=A0A7W5DN52_9PORP|nr:glycosyltransferase [Microbacter margulisiae]MBB3185995.1 alpha-1,3-rhamnosyltransferase [Microbacter margulisiae]